MKCLIVINTLSGNFSKLDVKTIINEYSHESDVVAVTYIHTEKEKWKAKGYDKVVVCGGDGTLSYAINVCQRTSSVKSLVYVACGTFNEASQTVHTKYAKIGKIGKDFFSYVSAVGSFTDIGYTTDRRKVQKHKVFAYFWKVLSSYRTYGFNVELQADDFAVSGKTTLLMFINSNRCFGFNFNRLYNPKDDNLHVLWIKGYDKDNLLSRIKMFFPMFRAFFIGFDKPYDKPNMKFLPVSSAKVKLGDKLDFCLDGERKEMEGEFEISSTRSPYKLKVIDLKSQKK